MVGRCIPYWNSPFLGDIRSFSEVFAHILGLFAHILGKTRLKWMIWGSPYFSETSTPFPSNGGHDFLGLRLGSGWVVCCTSPSWIPRTSWCPKSQIRKTRGLQWKKTRPKWLFRVGIRYTNMGVSKNRGTPKWMVYSGRPYWNGWFGFGGSIIFGNTHICRLRD